MNASQQHMLDAYRAARRGEEAPILPGAGTVHAVRDIREWRRFRNVVTDPADRLPARTRRALRAAAAAAARLLTGRAADLPHGGPVTSGAPAVAGSPLSAHAQEEVGESGAHVLGRPVRCG